jgi:hypothetical protein
MDTKEALIAGGGHPGHRHPWQRIEPPVAHRTAALKFAGGVPISMVMATSSLQGDAWLHVFNRPAFHALNLDAEAEAVVARHEHDGRVVGALTGVLTADGVFTSGHSAPFGGPDFARPRETPANVAATLDDALEQVTDAGARTIRIRCRSEVYGENEALIAFTLLNRGFTVQRAELAHVIDLARTPTPEAYRAALKSPARRALGHTEQLGLRFTELTDEAAWRDGHALLAENRAVKQRRLSLDSDYVLAAREALPGVVRMFGLADPDGMVAAAIVYVTSPTSWYVYAWGDARHELPRSPMNLLAVRLIETALDEGVRVFDLGSSTVPGAAVVADAGLSQFKVSLLARHQARLVLTR